MPSFGKIISPSQIEKWVADFSNKWFTEYLAAVEREVGKPPRFYAELATIVNKADFTWFVEEHLPCLVLMNAGLAGPPVRRGAGWDATYLMGAAIVVSSTDQQHVRNAMNDYGAAFRTMILQKPSLERSEVRGIEWVDERPAPLPSEDERSLGAVQIFFNLEVSEVVNATSTTPEPEPRPDPYETPPDPSDPTIITATPTITLRERN